jgi:hypothetical protein
VALYGTDEEESEIYATSERSDEEDDPNPVNNENKSPYNEPEQSLQPRAANGARPQVCHFVPPSATSSLSSMCCSFLARPIHWEQCQEQPGNSSCPYECSSLLTNPFIVQDNIPFHAASNMQPSSDPVTDVSFRKRNSWDTDSEDDELSTKHVSKKPKPSRTRNRPAQRNLEGRARIVCDLAIFDFGSVIITQDPWPDVATSESFAGAALARACTAKDFNIDDQETYESMLTLVSP